MATTTFPHFEKRRIIMDRTKRPFTTAIVNLRRKGASYEALARRCGYARSTAWLCNLVNAADAWELDPPGRLEVPGFAAMLGVSQSVIKAWIAAEWYDGVDGGYPPDVIDLATVIAGLDDSNKAFLAALAQRMAHVQAREARCDVDEYLRALDPSARKADAA